MARAWSSVSTKGEAGDEFLPLAVGRGEQGRFADPAGGRDADELASHVADALLHLGFARLPTGAAELVERDAVAFAEAGQKLDVFDREVKLFEAVVDQAQAVVRGRADAEGFEAIVAADAVFLVHDQIALGDLGGFRDELVGTLTAPGRAGDALAEQVLLGR